MDQHAIERTLADLPIGAIRYYPIIGSTNDEAARWADQGAPDLALVVADEQTAGRGRAGRQWHTPPGSALAFSLVLEPRERRAPAVQHVTALGALSVQAALKERYALPAQIKWPNDVLIGRSKVAGVLAEARWMGDRLVNYILGIGINIAPPSISWASQEVSQMDVPVTCLQDEVGKTVHRLEVLHEVLKALLVWRSRLGTRDFTTAWESALAFRGEWVLIYQDDATPADVIGSVEASPPVLRGQLLGLAENGALMVRSSAGDILQLHSGEVRVRLEIEQNPSL